MDWNGAELFDRASPKNKQKVEEKTCKYQKW